MTGSFHDHVENSSFEMSVGNGILYSSPEKKHELRGNELRKTRETFKYSTELTF